MKRTKLVIFDLDGTLLDTIDDLGNAVNSVLEKRALPQHALPEYKKMVGRGMRNLIKDALPEEYREKEDFLDSFFKDFIREYLDNIDRHTIPYPGMKEALKELQREGYSLAVASNKVQEGTERLIRKFFPETEFAAVCGNREGFPLKPDAALVRLIMDRAGADASGTILIGDSEIDIRTARNAGIPVIAVSWGFRPFADIQEADCVVSSAKELLQKIQEKF